MVSVVAAAWPMVALGEVLRPVDRSEPPVVGKTYRTVGVKWWGEGVYEREPIDGSQTQYNVLRRIETGDIIINKIWARHGSVAVVQPSLSGCYASTEFPTWVADPNRLAPRWMHWLSKTKGFWEQCEEKSRGTSGKNRIRPEKFLEITIPLPPLDEQRRIVARIVALAARIEQARGLRRGAALETDMLLNSVANDVFPDCATTVVRDFATIQSGYAFQSEWFSDEGIRLVRNINIGHGNIIWDQIARLPSAMRGEYSRFELSEGDLLISLDRPIISTGVKVARVKARDVPALLLQRVGRVQFHSDAIIPDYFFAWLQSPRFVNAIDPGRSNGVPHISQKDIERISFSPPRLSEQRRVVDMLDCLRSQVDALKAHQSETAAELEALLPAVLERAFRGEL